jgi:hypothetical protein
MRAGLRELKTFSIGTADGDVGRVRDAYFEDQDWTVRYLVVDTSHWRSGRSVLISPRWVSSVDRAARVLRTSLTRAEVVGSPGIDTAKPVSRLHTLGLARDGSLAYYLGLLGASMTLAAITFEAEVSPPGRGSRGRSHLRSVRALAGQHLHALDTDIGRVAEALVDEASWGIRDLVVTLGGWFTRNVLVPVGWVARVSREAGSVDVALESEMVRTAPRYEPARGAGPADEARFLRYYGPPPSPRPDGSSTHAAAAGRRAMGSVRRRSTVRQSMLRKKAST